jgi:hypothetical protein
MKITTFFLALLLARPVAYAQPARPGTVTLTHETLKDKIMGGWAGQTIGVTFGGPTELSSTAR